MPFASAYVLAFCHCILEHRIRFKVGFILERCLAIPISCRTNNASSMLFYVMVMSTVGNSGRQKTKQNDKTFTGFIVFVQHNVITGSN